MDRNIPALDDSGSIAYMSSFRWSELHSVARNGKRVYFVGPHPLNTFFYPLDWIVTFRWTADHVPVFKAHVPAE